MARALADAVKAGAALAPFMDDDRTAPLARALADAALFAAHRAARDPGLAADCHTVVGISVTGCDPHKQASAVTACCSGSGSVRPLLQTAVRNAPTLIEATPFAMGDPVTLTEVKLLDRQSRNQHAPSCLGGRPSALRPGR